MKSVFIAGNWKSNKTSVEAEEWLKKFSTESSRLTAKQLTVVLCVPFTILGPLNWQIKKQNLPIALGAQDISPFDEGAFTGEIAGRQIKEFADWVIVGHSERRKEFGETDEILHKKTVQAKKAGLKVIFCVPDDKTVVPGDVDVVAYEPVWAIGTGKAENPQQANAIITRIKSAYGIAVGIYGGSVTAENVSSFVSDPNIDGILPGKASLDPDIFFNLVEAASANL